MSCRNLRLLRSTSSDMMYMQGVLQVYGRGLEALFEDLPSWLQYGATDSTLRAHEWVAFLRWTKETRGCNTLNFMLQQMEQNCEAETRAIAQSGAARAPPSLSTEAKISAISQQMKRWGVQEGRSEPSSSPGPTRQEAAPVAFCLQQKQLSSIQSTRCAEVKKSLPAPNKSHRTMESSASSAMLANGAQHVIVHNEVLENRLWRSWLGSNVGHQSGPAVPKQRTINTTITEGSALWKDIVGKEQLSRKSKMRF